MANYANTKATIDANVYTNANNEVTAAMVNAAIDAVVDTIIAGGFLYKGVAHPADAAVTPDANCFWIATEAGAYTNKNGYVLDGTEAVIIKYNGSWSKENTGIKLVSVSQNTITVGDDITYIGVIKSTGDYSSTAYYFNDYAFKAGETYYVKLLTPRYYTGLSLGVADITLSPALVFNQWVEITSAKAGTPFIVTPSRAIPPVILFCNNPGIIAELENFGDTAFDNSIIKDTGVYESTIYSFKNFIVEKGFKYYVKLLTPKYTGLYLAVGSQNLAALKYNEWVEVSPTTAGGNPFIITAQDAANPPVLLFSSVDGGAVAGLQATAEVAWKNTIVKSTGVFDTNAYFFSNYAVAKGIKYYVKLLTQKYDGMNLIVGSETLDALKFNAWVEITPALGSGTPAIITITETLPAPVVLFSMDGGAVADSITQDVNYTTINVSYDGTSKTGRTIQFSGLTAISDAIASVEALANENNRYIIHVEGAFLFTDPLDVPMLGGGEYSIIWMNPYIEIEGDGPENSCIMIDFPANATFHDGKNEADYQPVYFYGYGGKIRGMKIAGRNCRYTMHIEAAGASINNQEIEVEDCELLGYGRPDYGGQTMTVLGTGLSSGLRWKFKNCKILDLYGNSAIGIHTPLSIFQRSPRIEFENCVISGQIGLGVYPEGLPSFLSLKNCELTTMYGAAMLDMRYFTTHTRVGESGDYSTFMVQASHLRALFRATNFTTNRGAVLRVVSASTGLSSTVRFPPTSSAFNVIIGDSSKLDYTITPYGWNTQLGYVYRDGGVGISGQAFGTIDIDEDSASGDSLASRLGDCSVTEKRLWVRIDGTLKTIVFNEDYTSKDNAYVLAQINTALGGLGVADVFCSGKLYYPSINGLQSIRCDDAGSIMRGMGVVFTANGMRRAKSSDGYIDGICLDDTANGQMGRIITRGFIDCYLQRTALAYAPLFTTIDDAASVTPGATLGIGATDGEFAVGATPALLRFTPTCLEIM